MYLCRSEISCGIYELCEIGIRPKRKDFDACIDRAEISSAIVIASLTSRQKKSISFLRKNGFKMFGRSWRKNPNSGNKIALFVKKINTKRNKAYRVMYD